eukprot:gnl/MRDRNA2_/MRDRNA2_103280_c0_seq1.p1 gnl/MRDRNA2_/MRDRNA2_103280_c0~~gnl/MRDRNA2_/MRDRNA2_103280_c0_seq1.p1  ORF type:complete len:472 (-),score=103.07 gnl/MRDRNA2_/MRDRNA2_103280_c0_seq1:168-1583(-)
MASANLWLRPKLGISRGPGGTVRIDAVLRTTNLEKAHAQLVAAVRNDLAENIERAILFVPGVNKAAAVEKRIRVRRIDVQEPTQTCINVDIPLGHAEEASLAKHDEGSPMRPESGADTDAASDDDCKFVVPWQTDGGDGGEDEMQSATIQGAGLSAENFARALGEGGSRALAQQDTKHRKQAESQKAQRLREKQVAQAAEAGRKLGKALAQMHGQPGLAALPPEASEQLRKQMLSSLCEQACEVLGAQLYAEDARRDSNDSSVPTQDSSKQEAIDQRLWSEVGRSVASEIEDLTEMGIFIPRSRDPSDEEQLWAEVGRSLAGQLGATVGPIRARSEALQSSLPKEVTRQVTVLSSGASQNTQEQEGVREGQSLQIPAYPHISLKDRPKIDKSRPEHAEQKKVSSKPPSSSPAPLPVQLPLEAKEKDPVFWAEVGRRFARQTGATEEQLTEQGQEFWAKVGMEIAAKCDIPL